MTINKIELAWIVVADIEKAIEFYTKILGLKLNEFHKEFGWAELSGTEGGALLGIAQANDNECLQPGENAVVTLTVSDIVKAKEELSKKNVTFMGDILEVPYVVKLQLLTDSDGNKLQLVQSLK